MSDSDNVNKSNRGKKFSILSPSLSVHCTEMSSSYWEEGPYVPGYLDSTILALDPGRLSFVTWNIDGMVFGLEVNITMTKYHQGEDRSCHLVVICMGTKLSFVRAMFSFTRNADVNNKQKSLQILKDQWKYGEK